MRVSSRAQGPTATGGQTETVQPGATRRANANVSDILAAARQLRAFSFEMDPAAIPDLVRAGGHPDRYLWAKSELTILGCGEALRLPLPAGWVAPEHTSLVQQALSAINTSGNTSGINTEDKPALPGAGPLAIGALPYDPGATGHLTVPRLVLTLRPGRAWATLTVPAGPGAAPSTYRKAIDDELVELARDPSSSVLPDRFELSATLPHEEWKNLVARAVKEMESGSMSKVVLARQVEVVANRPFALPETLSRLAHLYPSCAVFHVEGFLGASPETLLRRAGADIESHPLAGTVARSGDPATDDALVAALMSSSKDRREHQLVVDQIAAKLRPLASLYVPEAPSVVPLRNVSHLGTSIKGTLHDGAGGDGAGGGAAGGAPHSGGAPNGNGQNHGQGAPLPTSLELAALLQPTPAVGGLPVEAAIQWQRDNEGFDRGCYAGPLGWVDSAGDGEWVLGLRSARVSGNRAVMYAGNGIVTGSDPDAELGETQLKLQALLAALVRP
jgi:menaquinone-specific isochorismate synthase